MGAVPGGFPRLWGPHRLLIPPGPSTLPSTLGVDLSSCLAPPGGGLPGRSPLVGLSGSPPPLPVPAGVGGPSLRVHRGVTAFMLQGAPGCSHSGPFPAVGVRPTLRPLCGAPPSLLRPTSNPRPWALRSQEGGPGREGPSRAAGWAIPVPTPSDRPELGSLLGHG